MGVFRNWVGATEQLLQVASLNLIGRQFYIKKMSVFYEEVLL